jgi:hypothetical protein
LQGKLLAGWLFCISNVFRDANVWDYFIFQGVLE